MASLSAGHQWRNVRLFLFCAQAAAAPLIGKNLSIASKIKYLYVKIDGNAGSFQLIVRKSSLKF